MLPTLGLASATLGLLLILYLVFREEKSEAAPAERNMLLLVSFVTVVVAVVHIFGGTAGSNH